MKLKLKYRPRDKVFPNQASLELSYGKGKKKAYQIIYINDEHQANPYRMADELSTFLGGAIWKEVRGS